MKKVVVRIISVFLVCLMVLGAAPLDGFIGLDFSWLKSLSVIASAAGEVYTEGIWNYTVNNGCAIIQKINTKQPEKSTVIIPNRLGGYPVTEINDLGINTAAFSSDCNLYNCTVVIPYGVTKLGGRVFNRVSEIAIYLPESLKEIGFCCFNRYGGGSIGTFYYQGSRSAISGISNGGSNDLFYNGNIVCDVDYSSFYMYEEEVNNPIDLGDSVTISVVGKKGGEYVPLDGAAVSLYLGGRRIAQKPSTNGKVVFAQEDLVEYLKTVPFDKIMSSATVSAHYSLEDGFELCSEEVLSDGSWAGTNIQDAMKSGLVADEPRWCVSLKVAVQNYKLDKQKLLDELEQYSYKFANATNGHVIITNLDVVLIPIKGSKGSSSEIISTELFESLAKSINADIWINSNKYDTRADSDMTGVLDCNRIDCINPGYNVKNKGITISINDYNLSNTLCHESGHYLFGFIDEYNSGLGIYGKLTHPEQNDAFEYFYDYDENGDGIKNNKDEYYACWSSHDDASNFEPADGMVDRPAGAPTNFGLMDIQHVSYEISTNVQYSYIDNINTDISEEEKARSLTCQYYMLGASCEQKMAYELQKKAGSYQIDYSFTDSSDFQTYQTAEYNYAGGSNVNIKFSEYDKGMLDSICSISENDEVVLGSICAISESDEVSFSMQNGYLVTNTQSIIDDLVVFSQTFESILPQKINDTAFMIPAPKKGHIYFVSYLDINGNSHFLEISNDYDDEINEKKDVVLYSANNSEVLTITSTDCFINGEYESVYSGFWAVPEQGDTIYGTFSSSLSIGLNIDYSSLSWFVLQNNNWVKVDSNLTIDDHKNINVSCSYSGEGLYVLMAKAAQKEDCFSPSIVKISKDNCIYDDQIVLSIDDKNENSYLYKIYYSKSPISDVNDETVFSKTIFASNMIYLDLNDTDSLYYFRVAAQKIDGSESEVGEQFSYYIKANDGDLDGIPDYWFDIYTELMNVKNVAKLDSDDDGLTNLQEYQKGTNPLNPDTDGDNVYDQIEVYYGLDPLKSKTDNVTDDYIVAYGTPDLQISNLQFDDTKIYFTVDNKTDSKAMRTIVRIKNGNDTVEMWCVNVDENSSINFSVDRTLLNGLDSFVITVDDDQITHDSNYQNNTFSYCATKSINMDELYLVKNTSSVLVPVLSEGANEIFKWTVISGNSVRLEEITCTATAKTIGKTIVKVETLSGIHCMFQIAVIAFEGFEYTDFDCTVNADKSEVSIIGYYGDDLAITIPGTIGNIPVTTISSLGSKNFESVSIPDTVKTISPLAFANSASLKNISVDENNAVFSSKDGVLYSKDATTLIRCPINIGDEINVSSGVNVIGEYSFNNCTNLEKVTLPEGVVSLGEAAFSNCSKLTEISLPNTLEIIQTDAFYRCSSLMSVSIPNNVKEIGEYAFGSCLALESVTIGEGVESIGNSAFRGCSALNSVTLNAIQCQTAGGTTSRSAFYGCSNLANIMFGEKVERIPNNFLYNSSKITDINLPNSVKKVGTRSFYNCSKINNLSLSANLISIEAYGFYGCQAITEVSLPDTLQNIGDFAFSNCKGLTEITIPIGTKFIKDSTFNGCSNLTNISVVTGNEFFASDDGVLLSIDKTNLVRCPEAKSGIYTVPNTVTSSGTYCFTNCKNITVVCKEGSSVHSFCVTNSIPYTFSSDSQQYSPKTVFSYKGHIYEIYDDAKSWKDAKAICEMKGGHLVTIADSTENSKVISAIALAASTDFWIGGTDEASEGTWTWINGESFNYSNWDTNQPDNANSGEHYAEIIKSSSKWNDGPNNAALGFICEYETSDIPFDFNFADNNTMVTITGYTGDENDVVVPDTIYGLPVTNISGTFAGCTFESITLGENVSTLTTSTLTGCTNLKNIYVDNDNQNFVSADGVVFDKAQTKIYKYPVGKQTEEYIIPSTVTSVGNYAFYETQVKKVVFPEELLSIGSYGFAYSQIESIEIPVNVQSIGLYAFRYCYSLTSVHFNAKDVSVSSSSLTQRYGVFPYTVEELIIGSEVTYLPRYLISGYYKDSSLKSVTIPPSVRSMSASTFYDCSGLVVSSYYNSPARSIASGTSGLSWNQLYCGDCQGVWQTTKAVTCLEDGEENFCCQVCGAILETKTIAATGHKFDAYAYDDAQHWKVCSCGETQEKESHSFSPYQIHKTSGGNWIKTRSCTCGYSESSEYTGTDVNLQYDNLFDFLSYVNNDLSFRLNAEGNTVSASYSHGDLNADNGVITITTGKEGETETYDVFTRYSLQNGESYYNIAVKPNTKYTLTFDVNTKKAAQCYVFANDEDYDIIKEDTIDVTGTFADENGVLYYGIYRESQTVVAEFTTTDNTAFIQIRFGNSKFYDQTSTFSNIRIVESEMQTGYACGAVGKIFLANTAFGLLSVPCKDDYVFVGWYTQENASGKRITNENYSELSQSTQLFSYWKKVDIPRLTAEKNKIHIGEQVQMAYSYPYQTVTPTDVQWDVDKPYLAQVDANGLLTATNAGYVTVTATDETGRSASCRIHILPNTPVIGIFSYGGDYEQKLDWWKPYSSASLCLGYHAYNCEEVVFFRWSSNNKKVQVDQNGVVTNSGRFCRKATITVTGYNADGQVVTSSDITVAFYKFNWQEKYLFPQSVRNDCVTQQSTTEQDTKRIQSELTLSERIFSIVEYVLSVFFGNILK